MKLMNLEDFLKCPEGTIYRCGYRWNFGNLSVKYGSIESFDWFYMRIGDIDADSSEELFNMLEDSLENKEKRLPLDLKTTERDGLYEDDRLFLVFEKHDVDQLADFFTSLREEQKQKTAIQNAIEPNAGIASKPRKM